MKYTISKDMIVKASKDFININGITFIAEVVEITSHRTLLLKLLSLEVLDFQKSSSILSAIQSTSRQQENFTEVRGGFIILDPEDIQPYSSLSTLSLLDSPIYIQGIPFNHKMITFITTILSNTISNIREGTSYININLGINSLQTIVNEAYSELGDSISSLNIILLSPVERSFLGFKDINNTGLYDYIPLWIVPFLDPEMEVISISNEVSTLNHADTLVIKDNCIPWRLNLFT